jgi:hypothetical protein
VHPLLLPLWTLTTLSDRRRKRKSCPRRDLARLDDVPPSPVPWQFLIRAVFVATGLVLLLFVDVHGAVFYVAWSLIVIALLSEAAATYVAWLRRRP